MTDKEIDSIENELGQIKKLMIMQSLAMGYTQTQIAKTLEISTGKLSNMMKGAAKAAPDWGGGGGSPK